MKAPPTAVGGISAFDIVSEIGGFGKPLAGAGGRKDLKELPTARWWDLLSMGGGDGEGCRAVARA